MNIEVKIWRFIAAIVVLFIIALILMARAEAADVGCPKPLPHKHHAPTMTPVVIQAPCQDAPIEDIPEAVAPPAWARWPEPLTIGDQPLLKCVTSSGGFFSDFVAPGGPTLFQRVAAAPEMDATSAASALTLLAGLLTVVVRRNSPTL